MLNGLKNKNDKQIKMYIKHDGVELEGINNLT